MERDTNKLPEPFKTNWLKALRSGEYKQGETSLYNSTRDRYCCLGVACRVAGYNDIKEARHDQGEWISGRATNVPEILRGPNELAKNLADMNDGTNGVSPKTFDQIADYIEKNL